MITRFTYPFADSPRASRALTSALFRRDLWYRGAN